jgi:hypothetical protein
MQIWILTLLVGINAFAIDFISPDLANTKSLKDELMFIQKSHPIKFDYDFKNIESELVLDLAITNEIKVKAIKTKFYKERGYSYWYGKITNDPFGKIIIVFKGDSVAIELTTGGAHYWLLQRGSSYHLVQSVPIDESFVVKEARDYIEAKNEKAAVTSKSSNKFIDIMIVYTDDVQAFDSNVETVLNARVATMNQILKDSCVNFRYRLVHMQQVTYAETGSMGTDVGCIYAWSDGCLDSLHTLRDTMELIFFK